MVGDEVRKGKEWLWWFCPHICTSLEGFHGDPFGQDYPHFVIIQLFRLLMDRMEQKRRGGERGLLFLHSL